MKKLNTNYKMIKPVTTGHELKVKLLMLSMSQIDLSKALDINVKTANTMCNAGRLTKIQQLAIMGMEYTKVDE
jgi:plasmid maintenance system antidote protein VapI